MSQTGARVLWVDAARGLAIALVVWFHAAKRSVVAGSSEWWLLPVEMLSTVRMPLFFALAGLFAASWVGERSTWPAMLRAKVLLLVWVYVVWVGVRCVWFATLPAGDRRRPVTWAEVAHLLVWPSGGWFVVALAVMFVVARAVHRVPPIPVLALASLVSVAFLAEWVRFSNPAWDGIGTYTAFFLFGVVAREQVLRHAAGLAVPVTVGVPLAWAALYLALASQGIEDLPVIGFLLRLAGVAAGICVALRIQHWSALRALGRGTLPVYLSHQLLVVTAVAGLSTLWSFDEHPVLEHGAPVLLTVALLLVTYGFGVLAPRIGLGWLFATPRWLVRLTGERHPKVDGRRLARR